MLLESKALSSRCVTGLNPDVPDQASRNGDRFDDAFEVAAVAEYR